MAEKTIVMAKLNQILMGLALLLCAAPLAAQSCYVQLDDATGVPLPPAQLSELEAAACELRDAFPVEFQNDFAVYDFGFYLHQEGFAGGVPEVFQAKVTEVEQESAYFLLFGRQLSRGGNTSEVWVEVRLPEGSQYPCLEERAWMIQQLAKAAADEVYANQGRSILAYAAAADSSMSFLQSQIDFAVNCCPLTGGRTVANPNCPASYLDNVDIPEVLGIAGFVALENVQNVRVDSISTPYNGGGDSSSISLEIIVDVVMPNGQVQANINITQELLQAQGQLAGIFVSIQEFDEQNDKAVIAELYGNEVDLNSIGNGFTYWEELLAVKDGDTYTLYTRTGGHGGAQFRGGSPEVRSQAVILPAIVVRIVLRRAVMAASNVAINLFIEFVMERAFGDHGPDCTWLETASYMDIHPWRIGLWALEGAVGGHSIALAAVFGGADAAITYLLTTGSGQFSLDAFFLAVTEGALIGAGASHLSTVILNSKTAKKFFARVEAQTGSTIAQLDNELSPMWKPFLKDFRRVGAWEACASDVVVRQNVSKLDKVARYLDNNPEAKAAFKSSFDALPSSKRGLFVDRTSKLDDIRVEYGPFSWDNFITNGFIPANAPQSLKQEIFNALVYPPSAQEKWKKVDEFIKSGGSPNSGLLEGVDLPVGTELVKITPHIPGNPNVGPSQYWMTRTAFNTAKSHPTLDIEDFLGLPAQSHSVQYDVISVVTEATTRVYRSNIAPTTQGAFTRSGGGEQIIVPNINSTSFSDRVLDTNYSGWMPGETN